MASHRFTVLITANVPGERRRWAEIPFCLDDERSKPSLDQTVVEAFHLCIGNAIKEGLACEVRIGIRPEH